MLTDDELAEMQQQWNDDLYPSTSEFYRLIAQAREANALRGENERLRTEINRLNDNAACRRQMVRKAVLNALDGIPTDGDE